MSDGYYYKFIGCKYDDPTQLDENFNFIGPSIWVGQGDKYLCDSDLKELIETGKKHFGTPKVILTKNGWPYPYNDYKGEYGMSNYSFGIPIKNKKEGDEILKAMDSDAFRKIISATKWSSGYTEQNMFKYFKKDFYKHPMFTINSED